MFTRTPAVTAELDHAAFAVFIFFFGLVAMAGFIAGWAAGNGSPGQTISSRCTRSISAAPALPFNRISWLSEQISSLPFWSALCSGYFRAQALRGHAVGAPHLGLTFGVVPFDAQGEGTFGDVMMDVTIAVDQESKDRCGKVLHAADLAAAPRQPVPPSRSLAFRSRSRRMSDLSSRPTAAASRATKCPRRSLAARRLRLRLPH
jgi:hypothetical protein